MKFGDVLRMRKKGSYWPSVSSGEADLRVMYVDPQHIHVIVPAKRGAFSAARLTMQQTNIADAWEIVDASPDR